MSFIQSAILGIVQGLTEFIPVSSTGHLILIREIMNMEVVGTLAFDAILQLATGLAVLIYFWRDLWGIVKNKNFKLILILIIGTIPAVILGFLLEDLMDNKFRSTLVVAISLIAGAVLFYLAERFNRAPSKTIQIFRSSRLLTGPIGNGPVSKPDTKNLNVFEALVIGLFQCLALVPGFSRSGATISGGLFMGLSREMAVRFSFLLSLPIIFGSGLKKVFDLSQLHQGSTLLGAENSLFIASIFAFIFGLFAIHFLLKFLKNHSLNYFGVYRIILAIVILIWL